MDVRSEMAGAEGELRTLLAGDVGDATTRIFEAYANKSPGEKDALVAVMIGRLVASEGMSRAKGAAG